MLMILNLTNNELSSAQLNTGFYNVKESDIIELENLLNITPNDNLKEKAEQLAELAFNNNSVPMVPQSRRTIYIDPPKYFCKYLESALLKKNLKVIYIEDGQHIQVQEILLPVDSEITINEPVTLEDLKLAKLEEIASARYNDEFSSFYYEAKDASFDTSIRSQIKLLQAVQKNKTILWKSEDGWINMEPVDFINLINAYEEYVESLFVKEYTLISQINNAESAEVLNSINW